MRPTHPRGSMVRILVTVIGLLVIAPQVVQARAFSPWSTAVLEAGVNSAAADGCPIESPSGLQLYLASNRDPIGGATDSNDIWVAERPSIDAPFGPDNASTEVQCTAAGGNMLKLTQWMVHVWSVPGWGNTEGGVFAEVNPELRCGDGTYYQLPVEEWAGSPLTTCRVQ